MEKTMESVLIFGPPLEMVEKGIARIIPYNELPHGDDWESWQRDEMLKGNRIFTQWLHEMNAPKFELPIGQTAVSEQVRISEEPAAA